MFKDCKTDGYNLEKSHANKDRLKNLILLIALAYTCAVFQGQKIKYIAITVDHTKYHKQYDNSVLPFLEKIWDKCKETITTSLQARNLLSA